MYTEDYENRGFPFRDFLLKLILIILFVFLLVWLLPKFIKPTTVDNKNMINEITAISSQIFSDNLDKMKEAAISYYTDDRLPQKEGEYHQMTLSEMIGLKIITPLVDKNNKPVDVEKSYVKITKAEDEYILKVNIKDSEKEDYYFSVVDVISALTESNNPRNYWNMLKKRMQDEDETIKACIEKINEYIEKSKFGLDEIAIIGDSMMDDVVCGNTIGVTTILLDQISKKEYPLARIRRMKEKKIQKKYW